MCKTFKVCKECKSVTEKKAPKEALTCFKWNVTISQKPAIMFNRLSRQFYQPTGVCRLVPILRHPICLFCLWPLHRKSAR